MNAGNPCSVCGNTDLNLIDGYYYCVECGTQDATARETIVEHHALADGTFAQTFKKRFRQVQDDKIEMTGEWYKWHAFNFVLAGLADDLIKLGAKPSFKVKLLWVWTRYIKKYQNKEELGLSKEVNETDTTNKEKDKDTEEQNTSKYLKMKDCVFRRMNYVTPMLIFTMIYVALNLDKNDVQLSHLVRFLKEKRLTVYEAFKYIPKEINFKDIPHWQHYMQCHIGHIVFTTFRIRTLALTLFKNLDLGYPVIPDIRKLVDNYITELCLPEDFKQLVLSLMYQYPCEFLNVDQKVNMKRVPDYEGVTMAYILVALKMCFGLDDEYELKLSDVVDRINEQENNLKCYKSGFMETDRLFSFREWLNYLQFRKKILVQNCLHTETEHFCDIDDLMYLEYVGKDTSSAKMSLEDEITLNILNKIPLDDLDIIPKSLFVASLTPLSTYSKVIGEHHKEGDVRLLICEDFTKYSLKYACEDLKLIDKGVNIFSGIKKSNKSKTGGEIDLHFTVRAALKTVFIKNCENKNWMKTKPPSIHHITVLQKDGKDSDSDLGYDSHAENTSDKNIDINSDNPIEKNESNDDLKLKSVREEDENVNIYDDDFIEIYYKEEVEAATVEDLDEFPEESHPANKSNEPVFSDEEDYNFNDTTEFNPNTFNRERAIKEIILDACKKYKIPTPPEYRPEKVPKRKFINDKAGISSEPKSKKIRSSKPGEARQKIKNILDNYYNCVKNDVINNIADQVQDAIHNATLNSSERNESFSDPRSNNNFNDTGQQLGESQRNGEENLANITQEIEQNTSQLDKTELEILENVEKTLFDENSDGEVDLDETIVKSDPKFDEKKYDIGQLYIKIEEETNKDEENDCSKIEYEPEIKEIVKQKIKDSAKLIDIEDIFDPEDDLPLIMVKEDILFQQEFEEKRKENCNNLINNVNIPKYYYYWLRHYKDLSRMKDAKNLFDNEARKSLPKNFRFILNECASILNCSPFHIYKCMQYLELLIMSKSSLNN